MILRRPVPADADRFVTAVEQSASLHGRWVHPPATQLAFSMWVESISRPSIEAHLGETADGNLACVVNINNITRGSLLSASLGYYGFAGTAGIGLVAEAVGLVVKRAFGELGLHRLEANIQPENERSRRVVESLGFRHEGFSPRYLMVGGQWRDHDRFAILNPNM